MTRKKPHAPFSPSLPEPDLRWDDPVSSRNVRPGQISPTLGKALRREQDWQSFLLGKAADLRAQPLTPEVADCALDLATALECVVPDRVHAIEMYLLAWKATHARPDLLARARALCQEIDEPDTAATIARLQYQQLRDPNFLLLEGLIWLDSSRPDRAVRPLMAAQKALPDSEDVRLALATARLEWPSPRTAAAELADQADETVDDRAASSLLTHSARILRGLGVDTDEYTELLCRALERDPWNESAYSLLEAHLVEHADDDRLLQINDMRAASTDSPERAADAYRRSGTRLVLRSSRLCLGLRLVLRSVELGHQNGLDHIPGYIASLSLLRSISEEAGAIPQYLNLLADGIVLPVAEDERAWLAVTGLEMAWNAFRLAELAQGYALAAAELAPEHPTLTAFVSESRTELVEPTIRSDEHSLIYLDQYTKAGAAEPPSVTSTLPTHTKARPHAQLAVGTDKFTAVEPDATITGLFLPTEHERAPGSPHGIQLVDSPEEQSAHSDNVVKQHG